ncbi:hypothetical protein HUJ04_010252 [Dendroctonus ponderosae]|nr:hypothetical protein HUJ04_010252 [Dendroctonus ponderosae]
MDESMRSLEIYQTNPVDSCEQCFFRRSNAIRRKGRRVISTRATFRRSPHFQKCVNQNQTDKSTETENPADEEDTNKKSIREKSKSEILEKEEPTFEAFSMEQCHEWTSAQNSWRPSL